MVDKIKKALSNQSKRSQVRQNQAQPIPGESNQTQSDPTHPKQAQRNRLPYQPNKGPRSPFLYLITDRLAFLRSPDITQSDAECSQLDAIDIAARAGCQLIQIREKDMSAKALESFTLEAIRRARPYGARVLVNDRLDVALATGADGVHLRATSIPVDAAREIALKKRLDDFLIGASTHSMVEAKMAEEAGADFVVCGPVYYTASKGIYGPPLGLAIFAEICEKTAIPVLALGGIKLSNYREALICGAAGLAAIGLFTDLDSLESNIRLMLNTNRS